MRCVENSTSAPTLFSALPREEKTSPVITEEDNQKLQLSVPLILWLTAIVE